MQEEVSINNQKTEVVLNDKKKNKRNRILALLLALLLLLLWGGYIFLDYNELASMDPKIYVANDENWTDWEGLDFEVEDSVVHISRYKYVAPNVHYYFSLDEAPQETAALKVNMQLDNFLNSALSLLTVFTPGNNVSLITDKDGHLGLIEGPDGEPEFSDRKIQMGQEYDLYLFLDAPNGEVSAYIDGTRVVNVERNFEIYPLVDVWLGSVWIGGNNDLGAPLGYTINEFQLGDEDLIIAAQSLQEFLRKLFGEKPWLWVPPALLLILLAAFFIMWILDKRKDKRDEIDSGVDVGVSV